MGRKYKRLIGSIVDWDNLMEAHRLARKGKRNQAEVAAFEHHQWEELGALQMELLWGTYQPGRYREFEVYEPKRRRILAAPYRDRVAQQAICRVCAPIWHAAMIEHNYACRPGKGTHAGADQVQRWLRGLTATGPCWVLKMDVSQYFPSISHRLAKSVIRRKIQCPATLRALDTIIDSTAGSDEREPIGIPVGNLTSQWIANLVGDVIDQWAKRDLQLRRYARYMDDMVVLLRSREEALQVRAAFEAQLASMGMEFSKTSILPASRGVNFLGYRIWAHKRLLRRDSIRRMRRRLRTLRYQYAHGEIDLAHIQPRIQSWIAHASHADSDSLRREVLSDAVFAQGIQNVNPTIEHSLEEGAYAQRRIA